MSDVIVFNMNRAYQCKLCRKHNYNPPVDGANEFNLMKDKHSFTD